MLELRGPVSVELELRSGEEGLDPEAWSVIVERLGRLVNEFRLSGTEPMNHPGIFDILEALERTGKFYHVRTTGLWGDRARVFSGLRRLSRFSSFLVDYPGHTPERYEPYKAVAETVERCVAAGFEVNTRTDITAHNWDVVFDIAESAFRLGAHYAIFCRLIGPPEDPRAPVEEQLYSALERIHDMRQLGYNVSLGNCVPNCFHLSDSYGCMGGITSAFVDARGNLYPCPCSRTPAGNLLEKGVTEVWRSPVMRRWRRKLLPAECRQCSRLSYCPGGCRAAAEHAGGDRDPLIRGALEKEEPALLEVTLEEELCPVPLYTVREEDFGWLLVRANQVIPVSHKATAVLQAFDGKTNLGAIEDRFGAAAVSFIYSLHVRHFVDFRLPETGRN